MSETKKNKENARLDTMYVNYVITSEYEDSAAFGTLLIETRFDLANLEEYLTEHISLVCESCKDIMKELWFFEQLYFRKRAT